VLVHPWDAGGVEEALDFVRAHEFGQLVAAGRDRVVPVVVPTQFLLADPATVLLHLARPNPALAAVAENPMVVLSVADDWVYVPSAWKAVGDEDPALGIPTTYYAAVQLVCHATVVDDPDETLDILRRQLARLEPDGGAHDPEVHRRRLAGIRGLHLDVREVTAKFKYGGNADAEHRVAVAARLLERGHAADLAARDHLLRRLGERPG
jgi:transcriptional regulator